MDRFKKVCEILTDNMEGTRKVIEILKDTRYSVFKANHWGEYGEDGADLYVMEYVGTAEEE